MKTTTATLGFPDAAASAAHAAPSVPADPTALARPAEGRSLTTAQLEARRLIHRDDSMREQADAFRELRTRLLALGGPGNFVTLIVPARHGCGGSFVARNLAAAFAFDEAKSALLVDCDAPHPSQGQALRVDATTGGLMDYLDNPAVDLRDVVYATGVPRLGLIPAGRRRETSGEAFGAMRMRSMVDSLRAAQPDRYLVLDGPPVQGSPDARILADLADLVVLVVGHGRLTPEAIDRAVATFSPDKFAGIVFNQRP